MKSVGPITRSKYMDEKKRANTDGASANFAEVTQLGTKRKRMSLTVVNVSKSGNVSQKENSGEKERTGTLPNRSIEFQLMEKGKKVVCGVDEAGRGPLAGPVVAAAVILPRDFDSWKIDDSKKLTEEEV